MGEYFMNFVRKSGKRAVSLFLAFVLILSFCAVNLSCSNNEPTRKEGNTQAPFATTTGEEQKPPEVVYEEDPALEITEVMVQSLPGAREQNGECYPWIELRAKRDVQLSEYSLLYEEDIDYNLPAKALRSGEYYLVYMCSDGFNVTPDSSARLTLRHNEAICQSFVYINRSENCSYLTENGGETSTPTPGYENARDPDPLIISELMCDNNLYPIDGVMGDWIEIANTGEKEILLSDYFISDKPSKPYISRLPDITLESGGYYVIFCDENLGFSLSKEGETVLLTRRDGVVSSSLTYTQFEENSSFLASGEICSLPSPGYENTNEGAFAYASAGRGLVINEVISSNTKYKKYSKDYFDMVELYNAGEETVNLGEYFLSDKSKELQRYRLPETKLAPGKYYIVYCTGLGGLDPEFSLSLSGDKLYLTKEDGSFCDTLNIPELLTDISYGRGENGFWYFETPTFGSKNADVGCVGISTPALSSVPEGVYEDNVSFVLSADGDIYYTTDGSAPTVKSKKYAGETIDFKSSACLRAVVKKEGYITSKESSFTYLVGLPTLSMPVFSVAVSDSEMFGSSGIYTKSKKGVELSARAVLFENGEAKFSVGCGIKLFGNTSVKFDKKSFQLKFKNRYGTSSLEYKVFDYSDLSSFKSLVLRSGSQGQQTNLINDEFTTCLWRDAAFLVQAFKPVNLYINGEYFGIYFIREKIDEDFVSAHTGADPKNVSIVYINTRIECGPDGKEWEELRQFAINNDLTKPENYEYIKSKIDFESLVDYFIAEMWCGQFDYTNLRVYKTREGDGKWRYILYDIDRAFTYSSATVNTYLGHYSTVLRPPNTVIYKLFQVDEFSNYFMEKCRNFLETTVNPERTNAVYNAILDYIRPDMPYEIERWKNGSINNETMASWEKWCKNRGSRLTQKYNDTYISMLESTIDRIKKEKL